MKKIKKTFLLFILILCCKTSLLANDIVKYNNYITTLVKKLLPSVVSIRTTSVLESSLTNFDGKYYYYNQVDTLSSVGSGFIISADGYILTNTHVIDNSDDIYVNYNNEEYKAELVGSDYISDIAVIKIKTSKDLPFFELKENVESSIGEQIIVVGNPYGLGVSVSNGVVSALDRNLKNTDYNNLIQTDAAINKGNSGGPMFNLNGEVIGITSMLFSEDGNNVGVGFAIPIKSILNIIERLKVFGYVQRGWLGIKTVEVDNSVMKILDSKRQDGVLVLNVIKNSPADKAGVLYGDVVISYNNKKIKNSNELDYFIKESAVDSDANLLILRNNEFVKIKARIKESPSKFDSEIENIKINSIDVFDMYLTAIDNALIEKFELYSKLKGLMVLDVKKNGWAENNGIEKGDIILAVNQKQLKTKNDLTKILKETKEKNNKEIILFVRKRATKGNVLLKFNIGFGY